MAAEQETGPASKTRGRCPICGKDAQHATRPFCSRRCADVDLARWMGGNYVIAGGSRDADEDGDDTAAAATSGAGSGHDPERDD